MRKSYVYKITCKITGEFYFGSSFNAKSDSYWGSGRKIKELIALYGKENFIKDILGEFDDRVEAHKVENEYIEQFINDEKCLNKHLDHKFGTYGEESRTKISVAHHVENLSKEYRAKLSVVRLGKHHTEDVKAKISAALRGKQFSKEHRAKMSAAHLGKTNVLGKHWRKNPVTGKREYYD